MRDKCSGVDVPALSTRYTPPDFVVKALQHTNVECTWDDDEKDRQQTLSNMSKWRQLQESDFQKYLASDDSSDDEDEDRRGQLRQLLLGDDRGDEEEMDDFFAPASDDEDGDVHKVHSFVPELQSSVKSKLTAKDVPEETPFEAQLRKRAESKKKKKELRKSKGVVEEKAEEALNPALDLMFSDDKEEGQEFDMRAIVKGEKDKGKKKRKASKEVADDFAIDIEDDRFSALLQKDGRFGIDPTSSEFKATPAMKKILKEQRKRSKNNTGNSWEE